MRNCNMTGQMQQHPCGCASENPYRKEEFVVAMAYVPWQKFGALYDTDKALEVGTIFPVLDKPFMPGRRIGRR